ncbi:GNAT family N-acetyltransferase [uncultured Tateyamaria sp.]|uniref:GNAT family N-acetyltransferase n=1 Tax=uncultured Tateyamaria sp. TaxID=455651 RepID=UPI002624CF32|nr:GNAT family N-acetyltransferase [uncultured Tateyamaria sp.]
MTDPLIRAATPDDVHIWRALRMDGIMRHPQAFIVSAEEAAAVPVEEDAVRLSNGDRFLAYLDDVPVGLIGLNRHGVPRAAHRGEIGPLYVVPGARGQGIADRLLMAVLDAAQGLGIWQLELSVYVENAPAIALYTRHGFELAGKIPNAIAGADGFEDDLIMIRILATP